jgi:3-phosphoshikimate 1-carboxyvinyltransferase
VAQSFPVPISLPRSKSIVIRCLIVHYLRTGTILPVFEDDPNDIKVVYNALKIILSRKKTSVADECIIDVQDCGAAYRFLMALLAATQGKWLLTGTQRLLQRPILPLVELLNAHGACIQKTETGWQIDGKELQIDGFEIDTSETSQFASAVMMSGVRCAVCGSEKSPSNFEGVSSEVRRGSLYQSPYLTMTQALIQTPNIDTSAYLNFADWSAAVFWIANALLAPNAHYFLKNLHFDGLQGDAEIVSWFKKWGLAFIENGNGIEIKRINHVEISKQEINVAQTPDLAMILAVLSVCYPFTLILSGLKNLNSKESNRLDIIVNELSIFTQIKKKSKDMITICKRTDELPKLFHIDSYNDHRFVMAWSLFNNFGKVKIQNPECVKKSYPTFLDQVNCQTSIKC